MITPYGQECKHYYRDFHRGRSIEECRLLQRRPQEARWESSLCKSCPVPGILRANACPNMMLEGRIVRHFLVWRRVAVSAFCLESLEEVETPHSGCGRCHQYWPGAEGLLAEWEESISTEDREVSTGSDQDSA